MTDQPDILQSFLTFRLGDELFAANVGKVLEILEIPRITKVPQSPDFMRGVINLRGSVLPVIDARAKFGLPPAADTINSCIIVLNIDIEGQPIMTGVVVDGVQEVRDIEETQVQEAPSIGSKYKSEFIQGMVKVNEQFIMMLDLDKVFSSSESHLLRETMDQAKSGANDLLQPK
jgi:purine-binding chemotaxis protein CheW